jgi:hypothetical protein
MAAAAAAAVAATVSPDDRHAIITARCALTIVDQMDGRFGLNKLALALAGSKAASVTSGAAPLMQLSTYGVLKPIGQASCVELLQTLTAMGLCAFVDTGRFTVLTITAKGRRVLAREESLENGLPKHLVARSLLK